MFYNISRGSSRENRLCKTYSYFSPSRIAQKACGKYCGHEKSLQEKRQNKAVRKYNKAIG